MDNNCVSASHHASRSIKTTFGSQQSRMYFQLPNKVIKIHECTNVIMFPLNNIPDLAI